MAHGGRHLHDVHRQAGVDAVRRPPSDALQHAAADGRPERVLVGPRGRRHSANALRGVF